MQARRKMCRICSCSSKIDLDAVNEMILIVSFLLQPKIVMIQENIVF
jgi:hypothetical protein